MYTCAANMQTYADEVIRLKNQKGEYARWRSNLNKDSETYEKKYNSYTEKISYCQTHIDGNLEKLNGEISKLPGFHFELSESSGNSDSGGAGAGDSGGDSSRFSQFQGQDNLVTETFTAYDDAGNPVECQIVINKDNGNYLVSLPDGTIMIYCQATDGTVYVGAVKQPGEGSYSMDNPAVYNLITDGHENTPNSSIFDTFSEQTYGTHNEISPVWSDSGPGGNLETTTVDVGGKEVTLPYLYSDNALHSTYFD